MVPETNIEGNSPIAPAKKRASRRLVRFGISAILLLGVFSLGMNVGNGQIHIRSGASNSNLPAQLNYSSVSDVYDSLKANYNGKLTEGEVLDGLKHGIAESANDPYTEYFTAKEAKAFTDSINSTFSGIGAELSQDADKNITVTTPIAGMPAEKAGLKAKDIIVSIDGASTQGLTVNEAVTKIRGPKGKTVKLEVARKDAGLITIDIVRDNIQVPSVTTKTLDGNIGYLQISSFANDTGKLTKDAADKLKQQGVKGIILDLRNDPGGYLDAAIDASSLWVPKGKLIVDERGRNGSDKLYAKGGNVLTDIPTVVLINAGSASSSEIMAGALHDNKEATIIGEKSYGKGVVQQLINFPDGSQLKVTVASWYRPNGQNIQHKGITPDQIVKLSDADADAKVDTQLNAAQAFLSK